MPIREFVCQQCKYKWERLMRLENIEGIQQRCQKCGSTEIRQVPSACNWNFRGLFEHWHLGED